METNRNRMVGQQGWSTFRDDGFWVVDAKNEVADAVVGAAPVGPASLARYEFVGAKYVLGSKIARP
jgi:hypothetical protein